MSLYERHLPDPITSAVRKFAAAANPHLDAGSLRLGGGTVLAARWQHRRSTDADLFCDARTYVAAVRHHGEAIEHSLAQVARTQAGEDTFVDQIATYTRIDGVEVTVLPTVALIDGGSGRYVPGTRVETLTNAEILAGKLVHRMCGAGIAEPRDLYDLALAAARDPAPLQRALEVLTTAQRAEIGAMIEMLPRDWTSLSPERPLLDVVVERPDLAPLLALLRPKGGAAP